MTKIKEQSSQNGEAVLDDVLGYFAAGGIALQGLEASVQTLVDREAIRDLISLYAHRVAQGRSIADLFTQDGAWTIRRSVEGPITTVEGMEALRTFFETSQNDRAGSLPMIHNILIRLDGDEASGICSNELRSTDGGRSIIASGYYEDRYRREGGAWKFVRRDTTFFHWVPIQQGWA